jgi:hypothetical protein
MSCNVLILFKKRQGNQNGGKENVIKGLKWKRNKDKDLVTICKDKEIQGGQ